MSTGTIRSKADDGVDISSAAPAAPPRTAARASRSTRRPCPRSSGREALTEPTPRKTIATVLVMLAASGGTPVTSRAG